jgi:hypothetical protein
MTVERGVDPDIAADVLTVEASTLFIIDEPE